MPLKIIFGDTVDRTWCGGSLESRKAMFALAQKVCKDEGLSTQMTTDVLLTIAGESGYNNECTNINRDKAGSVSSTDYYLCQVNDWWHVGAGKDFPSTQYVHDNPEAVVRWMVNLFKAGQGKLWMAYPTRNSPSNNHIITLLSPPPPVVTPTAQASAQAITPSVTATNTPTVVPQSLWSLWTVTILNWLKLWYTKR